MITLLSVDLDPISSLHKVYGLDAPNPQSRGQVMLEGLSRFLEVLSAANAKATFFVVGKVLQGCAEHHPSVIQTLQDAQKAGHRIANHSWSHRYDLSQCERAAMREEIARGHAELARHGLHAAGFRAPGYTMSPALMHEIGAMGYRYDSSMMPSPSYFAAKLAYVAKLRVRGRRSASSLRGFRGFLGGDRPHLWRQSSLWQVPISVTPWARFPMHGGLLLQERGAVPQAVREYARSAPYLHMHFHGSDLMAGQAPVFCRELIRAKKELQIPVNSRCNALSALLKARGGSDTIESALKVPNES